MTLSNLQSAYRKGHSTETALAKVCSDIITAMDKGRHVLLALLDLSAAFDTVDHDILLERLSRSFSVHGGVLDWLPSYLTNDILLSGMEALSLRDACLYMEFLRAQCWALYFSSYTQ